MTRARPLSAVLHRARDVVFAFGLLATAAGFAWSAPTPARAAGCTAPEVAVLVDLSHWGGSERLGCVSWRSSLTGLSALEGAGFSPTGTNQYGLSFICRIDGYPKAGAPDHETCAQTPPKDKYWSYWHADARQSSWTYSTLGVASYHPHAGSVDAWTFGGGSPPPVSPSAVLPTAGSGPVSQHATSTKAATAHSASRAHDPSRVGPTRRATATHAASGPGAAGAGHTGAPKSAAPASADPSGAAKPTGGRASSTARHPSGAENASGAANSSGAATRSGGATSGAGGTTSVRAGPAHPSTASSGAGRGASTTAGRTGASATAGGTPAIVANRSSLVAGPRKVRGSPWPTITGIVVVAALAAGGGWRAWRRRSPRTHAG